MNEDNITLHFPGTVVNNINSDEPCAERPPEGKIDHSG